MDPVTPNRCFWARHPLEVEYHDTEWGVPCHDDRELFERLILEGAQAGLSWLTILKKRAHYRRAFADFDPVKVAAWDEADVDRLLGDPGIVRNRLKIRSAIQNARAFLTVQEQLGTFESYVWSFVNGQTIRIPDLTRETIPARTEVSDRLSKDLRQRGFTFVGSTIVYAFMQSVGMADDHLPECFRSVKSGPDSDCRW